MCSPASMPSPIYSTELPWMQDGKGLVHNIESYARSCSPASTRCGTPATTSDTPVGQDSDRTTTLEHNARPDLSSTRRQAVDLKSRFCTSTACFRLNQAPVNLRLLALHIPGGNCVYNVSGKSALDRMDMVKVLMPIRRSGGKKGKRYVNIQVFKNGHVSIIGAQSYRQVIRIAARAVDKIKRSNGVDCTGKMCCAVASPADLAMGDLTGSDENGIRWSNIRFDFDLGFNLNLANLTSLMARFFHVIYEPELRFQGVSIKATPTAMVCVFSSGKGYVIVSKDTSGAVALPIDPQQSKPVTKGLLDDELTEAYNKVCEILWLNLKSVVNLSAKKVRKTTSD